MARRRSSKKLNKLGTQQLSEVLGIQLDSIRPPLPTNALKKIRLPKMETLDAHLLDQVLCKLTATEACSLAVVSANLRALVEQSSLWKTWCEHDCPSLTTSPAKELVSAHYGARAKDGAPDIRRCSLS